MGGAQGAPALFMRIQKYISQCGICSRRAEVWLEQGRKREIRRMFEVMGYFVKELKRFQIGSFVLRKIPEGACRVLSDRDIEKILRNPAF